MAVEDMVERLPGIAVSLEAAGMDVRRFASAPPVSVDAVREVEKVLKHAVPGSFWRVLTEIAGGVDFFWFAPADWAFTGPFRHIFSGELAWSLDALPRLARDVREWIDVVGPTGCLGAWWLRCCMSPQGWWGCLIGVAGERQVGKLLDDVE
ncbi:hypothetical protein [Kineosporia sp. A_224]|uniref:hypothetical protein n=1 Tax=Kineosporia sp. A_224 TaxID=1962180 RepID=UPI000B4BE66A|nr:hypothetical protein [Kineosporia sp. A_224]